MLRPGHRDTHRDAGYAQRRQEYRRANRSRDHANNIQRKYGLTSDEYQQIKKFQGGKCAICRRATGRTRRLSVDHDHKTREVRGLLCSPCNHMLGHIRDSATTLDLAIDYLMNHPAEAALGRVVLVPEDSPAQMPRGRRRR